VTLALLSASVYSGLLAYVVTRQPPIGAILGVLGGLGGVLLLCALLRGWDDALPWSIALLATAYAIGIAAHGREIDEAAPLVAAGLLLFSELARWSLDERLGVRTERAVVLSRARALAVLTVAGGAIAAAVVALSAAPVGGGLAWTILGAAAAVGAVALVLRSGRGY
jgi:hypothetical protein